MVGCNIGVAGFLLTVGAMFTVLAVVCFILLIRVHRYYRSSGASFTKAQAEFAQGVVSNRAVQQAATGVATAAVGGAVNQYTGNTDADYRY